MSDPDQQCLDLLYAFIAGFSVAALALTGIFTGLGGFLCR